MFTKLFVDPVIASKQELDAMTNSLNTDKREIHGTHTAQVIEGDRDALTEDILAIRSGKSRHTR